MNLIDWKHVQRRLHKLGFNPGPVDGIRGRMTVGAVKRFQESRGLVADGVVGPRTFAAMFGEPAPGEIAALDTMPWFDEAIRLIGLRETPGRESNAKLLTMAEDLDIDYDSDDIPWCGLFTAHCVGATMPEEALPTIPLRARAWEDFGMPVAPQIGAVMVFWRKSKRSGAGHVGYYFGEDQETFHILGGNQSDMVNVRRIRRDRFLQARWPLTAMDPHGETLIAAAGGEISTNEA